MKAVNVITCKPRPVGLNGNTPSSEPTRHLLVFGDRVESVVNLMSIHYNVQYVESFEISETLYKILMFCTPLGTVVDITDMYGVICEDGSLTAARSADC